MTTATNYPGGASQTDVEKWQKTFDEFAKIDPVTSTPYLDTESFVNAIAPVNDLGKISRNQYSVLFSIADTRQQGKVNWQEFLAFETTLQKPDAEFDIAFKLFDIDGNGAVSFAEFQRVFSENLGPEAIPFNFDSDWVKLYLGKVEGEHVLGYNEFTQLMKGLQGERLRQAFRHFDTDGNGFITPDDFKKIIFELARHKLSDSVLNNLPSLCELTPGRKISYSECIAFHNVIREMDMVEKVVREACARSPDGTISPADFSSHASRSMRYGTFSPMEVSIIFHFAAGAEGKARLGLKDFAQLLDPKWGPPPKASSKVKVVKGTFLHETAKSAYNFGLGGIAGALGATVIYPIDTVKTRMQNQRSKVVGELLYKNSFDCVGKIWRNEGFFGFYRGLIPQLVGVAPEKAIKLTINDLVREYGTNDAGQIALPWEIAAGFAAGSCQVAVTTPLEIVKIRLQMQGEVAGAKRGAIHIIKGLGLLGLYKGAFACFCRDAPFSAVYFSAYAHLKKDVFHEGLNGKKISFGEMLSAAAIAGMPAAYFTTPADVIKTRLQTESRAGEVPYKGMADAFKRIMAEEGPKALFKGGPARVLRSSPQFGVTLVAYEYLKNYFPYPESAASAMISLLPKPEEDLARIRARNALKVLLDVHEDFGGVSSRSGTTTLAEGKKSKE